MKLTRYQKEGLKDLLYDTLSLLFFIPIFPMIAIVKGSAYLLFLMVGVSRDVFRKFGAPNAQPYKKVIDMLFYIYK